MQTVAMIKEGLKVSNQGNDHQSVGVEVKNLRSAMARSNFRMGSTLPEHNYLDIG